MCTVYYTFIGMVLYYAKPNLCLKIAKINFTIEFQYSQLVVCPFWRGERKNSGPLKNLWAKHSQGFVLLEYEVTGVCEEGHGVLL